MSLFKYVPISSYRAFRRPATVILILGLFLLLIPGCLNTPKQETTSSSAAIGKVRKISKAGGTVSDLATGQNGPAGLVSDGSQNLYFTESKAGNIKEILFNGSMGTVLAQLMKPYDIVMEQGEGSEVLYFVEFDPSGGKVSQICLSQCFPGNNPGDVHILAHDQPGPVALTQDATYIYYVNREGKQIMRVVKDTGTTPDLLADSFNGVTAPQDIVMVGTHLYFTDDAGPNGALRCVEADGNDPTVTDIVIGIDHPGALETDGTDLYFAEIAPGTTNGRIWKVSAACAPGSPTVLADGLSEPTGIAVNTTDSDLYFTEREGGKIGRVPKDGSVAKSVVVENLDLPFRLIDDSTAIYFTETAAII